MEKTAVKYDSEKPPLAYAALIPDEALVEIGKVITYGSGKYGSENWKQGMRWTRYASAALRHLFAWLRGEDVDPESGLGHLAHCATSICFLIWYSINKAGEDDRAGGKDD